jgi:2,3-bisphosphoglycerate-independent phosphoglycerate mutase
MGKKVKKVRKPKEKLKVRAVLVRFTNSDFEKLEEMADALQIPIAAVIRQYAIKGIAAEQK